MMHGHKKQVPCPYSGAADVQEFLVIKPAENENSKACHMAERRTYSNKIMSATWDHKLAQANDWYISA